MDNENIFESIEFNEICDTCNRKDECDNTIGHKLYCWQWILLRGCESEEEEDD